MHFGKQLHLLAYQPWKNDYIDFAMLKHVIKAIFEAAKQQNRIVEVPYHWKDEVDAAQSPSATPTHSGHPSRASSVNHLSDLEEDEADVGNHDSASDKSSKKSAHDGHHHNHHETEVVHRFNCDPDEVCPTFSPFHTHKKSIL